MTENTFSPRNPKALLLASDPIVLQLVGAALEARGFEVRTASDGERGLRVLVDELLDLDVLVTELTLEKRDGGSLVHFIRGAGGERDLPIVVVTSGVAASARDCLLSLGADAVVDRIEGADAPADAALALAA